MNTPIIVAIISGGFGLLAALVNGFRKENRQDHAKVTKAIEAVHKEVHRVGDKVDRHIEWHIDKK